MIKANEENRTEDDEDYNVAFAWRIVNPVERSRRDSLIHHDPVPSEQRVWLLPIEWMIDSAHLGVRLPERALDLERTQDALRHQRQLELAKGASLKTPCAPLFLVG